MVDKASHSEVESFLGCERKHFYTYALKIQGKSVSDALVKGNVGHVVLADYYRQLQLGIPKQKAILHAFQLIRPEVEAYEPFDPEKMIKDLKIILGEYWKNYDDTELEILYVEEAYDIVLTDNFTLPVRIDIVVRVPGHGVLVWDHKFSANFMDVDKLDLNPQLPKYFAALDALNIHVDGAWYNEIRTLFTKDNKADPSLMFRRTPVQLKPKKVVTIMAEQFKAAKRISYLKSLTVDEWEKNILRNQHECNLCSFKTLCSSDLDGEDSDLIREAYYEPRSYR